MIARLQTRLVCLLIACVMVPSNTLAAGPVGRGVPVVRDAEIEGLVAEYTQPILKAAGLSRSGVEVILVNSPEFNAFVSGRRIFINTGTIVGSETPNELVGVIAHEIGHLAGGHQLRLREQMEQAQRIALIAGLLGAGVAVAGAATGSSNAARAGSGLAVGGGTAALRGLQAYQRSEETTADRSALVYLEKAGQSGKGLIQSFEGLERANLLSGVSPRRYITSHPAPRDRIVRLQDLARQSPYYDRKDDPALQLRHDLARAKIAAYGEGAGAVRRMFSKDSRGLAATYGEAISAHLSGSPAIALQKIDALIAKDPKSPWFHEIRGEILMEAGKAKEAAVAFTRAAKLDPTKSGLLQASIGQAMVTGGDADDMKNAIAIIKKGLQSDPSNASGYRFLAMAYGRIGDDASAELAMAEAHWQAGALLDARIFAARAQMKLKPGSPQWLQAQDIISTKSSSK
ncbi:peptidase [Aureimonas sp. SA4125]|uniref:M48 family metalloprotease n=1 Tax=Aureimonas sp. SA4125 TaxID=2826993 RepID=UPI001CC62816|nr:M48 family metalloprotease [Aureimonas sp. SA4125]BDA84502.1 peptidase [Aureimonas sp. SA4125]